MEASGKCKQKICARPVILFTESSFHLPHIFQHCRQSLFSVITDFMVCIYRLMKRSDKSLKADCTPCRDWKYSSMIILTDFMTPLCCQNLIKMHIMWSGIHHCTGVNDYTRCKESRIKPVVPNKHFQPRNCCRLSCKYLTCGSALKSDYKMHCGFLLYISDTILNLLSLHVKTIFSNRHVSKLHVNIRTQFSFLLMHCKSRLPRLCFTSLVPLQTHRFYFLGHQNMLQLLNAELTVFKTHIWKIVPTGCILNFWWTSFIIESSLSFCSCWILQFCSLQNFAQICRNKSQVLLLFI